MKRIITLKKLLYTAASAAVLFFTSCPQDITPIKVALAEDTMEPKIVIESPLGGDNFYSKVTVNGFIYDDVMEERDEAGSLSSIYFTIANDETRRGKIDFGANDSYTQDSSFGDIEIDYDLSSKEFSFEFPTIEPALRDRLTLTITAEDKNGNTAESELMLVESSGPFIQFAFYTSTDYSGEDVSSTSNDNIYIAGEVADSDYDRTTAGEIEKIEWSMVGSSVRGELDVSEDSDYWDAEQGLFKIANEVDDTEYFYYNPETRQFSTHTAIDLENNGSTYFTVTATDIYGHTTEEQNLLTPPASLMLTAIETDIDFYSPNPDSGITVHIGGKVSNPNEVLSSSDIDTVKYSFSSNNSGDTVPSGGTVYNSTTDNFNTFFDADGDLSLGDFMIDLDTSVLGNIGLSGDISVKIVFTDFDQKTISKSVVLTRDADKPVIFNDLVSGTDGKSYLAQGDTATLDFTVTDTGSGIDSVSSIDIFGTSVMSNLTISGNDYSSYYTFTSEVSADTGDNIYYSITVSDKAGNTKTLTLKDSDLDFYSPFTASDIYNTFSAASSNTVNPIWLRATGSPEYDNLNLAFTVDRVLDDKPGISVSGSKGGSFNIPSADISYNSSTGACAVSYEMKVDDLTDQGRISVNLDLTDAAGNSASDTITTDLYYDNSAPSSQPDTPVKPGNPGFINFNDMDSGFTLNVDAYSCGAERDDVIWIYLGGSSDSGTELAHIAYSGADSATAVLISDTTDLGTYDGSEDGNLIFTVMISDEAGNSADDRVFTLEKDTVVDSYNAGTSYSGASSKDAAFTQTTATAADSNGYTVEWSISPSGATMADDTALNVNITGASDNTYTATMTVTDGAGNAENSDFTFVWDTTNPAVAFTGKPSDWLNADSSDVTVTATGSDVGSGIASGTYSWSAVIFGTSTEVYTTTGTTITLNDTNFSTDGSYTVTATVEDQLGNSGSSSFDFDIDTSLPTASITELGTDWYNSDFTIDATTGDSLDTSLTYSWALTGPGSFEGASALLESEDLDISATVLPDSGTYTAELTVTDDAGNQTTASDTFKWDPNAPSISAIDDYYVTGNNNLSSSATDETNGSGSLSYNWSIIGPTAYSDLNYDSDSTFSLHVADLTDGAGIYGVTLTVTDEAGNPADETFNVYYDYDNIAPVVDLSSYDGGAATTSYSLTPDADDVTDSLSGLDTASYDWTVECALLSFSKSMNGETLILSTDSGTSGIYVDTAAGTYTVTLTAYDNKGNTASDSFDIIWTP